MRFPKSISFILVALLLASCSSSAKVSKASTKEVAAPTVEGLIAKGCDKYLAANSEGAAADFSALTKLDATYKEIETANSDIIETMNGVKTVKAITDLPEKDRQRVYESILMMENLCVGIDAP